MGMTTGDRSCTTGLSKRIYDAWQAEAKIHVVSPPVAAENLASAQDGVKAICYAIASAVISEIQTNARVTYPEPYGGTTVMQVT